MLVVVQEDEAQDPERLKNRCGVIGQDLWRLGKARCRAVRFKRTDA